MSSINTQKNLAALVLTQLKKLAKDPGVDRGRMKYTSPDDTAGSLPSYSSAMMP